MCAHAKPFEKKISRFVLEVAGIGLYIRSINMYGVKEVQSADNLNITDCE